MFPKDGDKGNQHKKVAKSDNLTLADFGITKNESSDAKIIKDEPSSQWATIAVEADEIVYTLKEATEKERRAKQAETQSETMKKEPMAELIPPQVKSQNETRTKLANAFNTNSRYVSDAQRLKKEKPDGSLNWHKARKRYYWRRGGKIFQRHRRSDTV